MKLNLSYLIIALSFFWTGQVFSQQGNLLNFDGVDDHIDLDVLAPTLTGANNFTVEFWMQASAADQTSSTTTILFGINDTNAAGGNILLIGIRGAATANPGRLTINNGGGIIFTSPNVIADGTCHHIAYVKEQGVGSHIYVDGNPITPATGIPSPGQLLATHDYGLGAEYDYNGANRTFDQFYDGDMDEVKIWNSSRTQAEVNFDMTSTTPSAGMIAYYTCDQGTAFGNNTGQASLTDIISGLNGTFDNFNLVGFSSNFLDYDINLTITSSDPNPCVGDNVILTANHTGSNSINYEWTELSNPSVVLGTGQTLTINSPGTYQVTGTSSCYNVISDQITVTFSPLPDVAPVTINACIGDTITICPQVLSGGPYQYDWGNGLTSSPCTTFVVSGPSGVQDVPVQIFNQDTCSVTIINTVNILPQPNVPITFFELCPFDAPVPFYTVSDADYPNNFVTNDPAVSEIPNSPPGNTTYVFDPATSGPGIHEITVSNDDGCAVLVTFEVINLTPFVPPNLLCNTSPPFIMFPLNFPPGCDNYSYTGDTQGIDQNINEFDPATALIGANTFEICYTSCNGLICCEEYTIFVGQGPNISLGPDVTLCQNATTTIGYQNDLGPNVTYSWTGPFTGTPPTNQLIQVNTPGTYCLTATGSNTCSTTDCIEVIAGTPIDVSPVSVTACVTDQDILICPQIGAGGPYSFDWGFGSSPLNICYLAPINGLVGIQDVPVTVTDLNGCSITIINQINVLPVPKLDILEVLPPCEGDSVALIATTDGPYGINWFDQNGNPIGTTGSGQAIYVTPNGPTTYTATTGVAPCDNTQTITVNPLSAPTVTADPDFMMCETDNAFNIALQWNGSHYQGPIFGLPNYFTPHTVWSSNTSTFTPQAGLTIPPGNGWVSFDPSTANLGQNPITYNVTSQNGCTGSDTMIITVCPVPQVTIDPAAQCTAGQVLTTTVTNTHPDCPVTYSWTLGPNTLLGETDSTINTALYGSGTYCVTATTGTNCSTTDCFTVTPAPVVTAVSDTTVCETAPPLNIAIQIGNSHLVTPYGTWGGYFTPNTFPTPNSSSFTPTPGLTIPGGIIGGVVFNPSAGVYGANPIIYTVTNQFGCTDSDTMNINVCPVPQVTISPGVQCQTAQTLSTTVTNTHPDCPVTYSWTHNGGFPLTGETASTIDTTPYGSGTYCVTATSAANCSSTDCFILEVNEPITISASIPPCDTIGATLTVQSNGTIDPGSIQWLDPNNNPAGNTATINVTMSGDYCVTAQVNGCPAQTICYTVTIGQGPIITTTAPAQVCHYDSFTASVVVNSDCVAPDVLTIEWYAGTTLIGTGNSLSVPSPSYPAGTVISVQVCCGGCCTTEDVITIDPIPIMTALAPLDISYCTWDGNPVPTSQIFTTTGTNCTYFSSTGLPGIIDPLTGLFNPVAAGGVGSYTINLTCELNGCVDTIANVVHVIEDADWHKTSSNAALQDIGYDVITDAAGNVYTVGLYTNYTEFDGEVANSFSANNNSRSFITKYSECGDFLWVANSIQSSPNSESFASSVTYDENLNLLYVAGNYFEDLRMLNGHGPAGTIPGIGFAPNVTGQQGYVACLDASTGQILYIDFVTPEPGSETTVNAITINENSGEIYVGGSYFQAYDKAFVEKFTPAPTTIGLADWQVKGYGDEDQQVNDMDFNEANEKLWTIGDYELELGFDVAGNYPHFIGSQNGPNNFNPNVEKTAFVAIYSGGNAVVEDTLLSGNAIDGEMTGMGISVDNGALAAYVTGGFEGDLPNAFMGATPAMTNPTTTQNAYFAKINLLGDVSWIHQADAGLGLATGTSASYKNGEVHFAGNYDDNLTITATLPAISNLAFNGTASNVFAISYSGFSGNLNFTNGTIGVTGGNQQSAHAISTDNNDHAFIVGEYEGEMGYIIQGAPPALNLVATPVTSTNAFTMRVDLTQGGAFRSPGPDSDTEAEVIFSDEEKGLELTAFPNPTRSTTTIQLKGYSEDANYSIRITGLDGRTLFVEQLTNGQVELDLSEYESGIYLINVSDGENLYTSRIVKTN